MEPRARRLGISDHGIVLRKDDGEVAIWRPERSGPGTWVSVPPELAQEYRLETGDVATGPLVPLDDPEPGSPAEGLASVVTVNGLEREAALERPGPRRRGGYDRTVPDRLLPLSTEGDETARLLDLFAPLAAGYAGLVSGPHGSGLTRTVRSVVAGVTANAPDVRVIVLLARARGEEITAWRRRFPDADVVACPAMDSGAAPELRAAVADMVLACAQRQTELGKHVLLAVDTLTAVWANMLETEDADAQYEADQSGARRRIREWIQASGWFGGEGLLGGGLGGSLTIVGTAWRIAVDDDEEEERESHPHLRLFEHILDGLSWHVPLSDDLAGRRQYPAIDALRCRSSWCGAEGDARRDALDAARRRLTGLPVVERHAIVLGALRSAGNLDAAAIRLSGSAEPRDADAAPTLPAGALAADAIEVAALLAGTPGPGAPDAGAATMPGQTAPGDLGAEAARGADEDSRMRALLDLLSVEDDTDA